MEACVNNPRVTYERKEREKDGGMRNDRVDAKREQRH